MLEAVPLKEVESKWRDCLPEAANLDQCWEESAFRIASDGSRVLGVIKGVRGLADLKVANRIFRVRSLLEVLFDAVGLNGSPCPDLVSGDLGRLLNLSSGDPCGVLIAGHGRLGYAVPLKDALTQLGLELLETPPTASKIELGYEALAGDVARSVAFDLGNPPLGMAA